MTRIRKSYFTLEELASGWGLPEADLRYVAENGLLKLSVRVVGVFMEFGILGGSGDGEAADVDPLRRSATTTGWSISQARRLRAVPGWPRRDRVFPPRRMATPRCCGTRTSSPFGRAISWCAMTSASGSRRRCCRPCVSTPTELRRLQRLLARGPPISFHADAGEGAALPARRGPQREPLAVRQGGARRGRLAAR